MQKIRGGTNVANFEKLRQGVAKNISSHKKGLTGQELKEAAAKAWAKDSRE